MNAEDRAAWEADETVPSDFSTVDDAATIASLRAEVARQWAIRRALRQANLWSWEFSDRAEAAEAEVERLRADLRDSEAERDEKWEEIKALVEQVSVTARERDALRRAVEALADEWDRDYEPCGETLRAVLDSHPTGTPEGGEGL